jgi:hypothetical protein
LTTPQGIRFHDAVGRGEELPRDHLATHIPRQALAQLYAFLEVVGAHLFNRAEEWKEHERFTVTWKDKRSLTRFMRGKYKVGSVVGGDRVCVLTNKRVRVVLSTSTGELAG